MNSFLVGAAALFSFACAGVENARALVGDAREETSLAPYTLMLLTRAPRASGFCTGVVVARDVVLTAAHCVTRLDDTRVYFKDGDKPVVRALAAISIHPQYRANAVATRERSIDLALARAAEPLPAFFRAASLDGARSVAPGERFRVAGYGVAREGRGETGGVLRSGVLVAREPVSSILLWAEDPAKAGFGACVGDSGGPIFAENSSTVVAIVNWATGQKGRGCGGLTQGALVAPQRAWIDGALRSWSPR